MLSHERVWAAIDALASRHGLHTSRLARKAGLDATSFNKSKRVSRKGREHWPSTESISKILDIEPSGSLRRSMIPLIGMEEAASGKIVTEDGMPSEGPGRDAIEFPNVEQEKVFALAVTGDALSPLYRDGDILIVSPTASTRKGDRIVVCTTSGEILAKELKRRSAKTLTMTSLAKDEDQVIPAEEIAWTARIMWARR